jgi:hypothetical protein
LVLSLALSAISGTIIPSYAHSYFGENLPSTSRTDDLSLEYDIATRDEPADGLTHTHIELSLVRAGEEPRFVTYVLNFTTIGDQTVLLRDVFHSENGPLVLDMVRTDGPVQLFGTQEPYLNAWQPGPSGVVTVHFPFEDDVDYRLTVEILAIDSIRNLFPSEQVPTTDLVFSMDNPSTVAGVTTIPEFPLAMAVMATALATVIVAGAYYAKRFACC